MKCNVKRKLLLSRINKGKGTDGPLAQSLIYLIMGITALISALPFLITFMMSLKTNYEAALGIWTWPKTPKWGNWSFGFQTVIPNMINSIIVCLIATAFTILFSGAVAYVFSRYKFVGKEIFFSLIIALMVIPGVLTLTPQYILTINLNIKNTWLALILPYIAGGQIGTIFLFRTFFSQQPEELFEAARIDGANDFQMFAVIAVPLAVPIIAIQSIGLFSGWYNDFMWPLLVIEDQSKQTLMPVIRTLTNQIMGQVMEQGIPHAMYILSGIPLMVTTVLGLKYFINGDFASGMKL